METGRYQLNRKNKLSGHRILGQPHEKSIKRLAALSYLRRRIIVSQILKNVSPAS
jgi:hypothetical protein